MTETRIRVPIGDPDSLRELLGRIADKRPEDMVPRPLLDKLDSALDAITAAAIDKAEGWR